METFLVVFVILFEGLALNFGLLSKDLPFSFMGFFFFYSLLAFLSNVLGKLHGDQVLRAQKVSAFGFFLRKFNCIARV